MRKPGRVLLALLLVLTTTWLVQAQSQVCRVEGVVFDAGGAVVPGVSVTATGPLGSRMTVTDRHGAYRLQLPGAGRWQVQAELAGFSPARCTVQLGPGEALVCDLTLRVSAVEEVVEVAPSPTVKSKGRRGAPAAPVFNTERYAPIAENRPLRVADEPRSTFSIDVDTAAYSNVRRFLRQEHRLPPPDAVRLEEMVNYFTYDYPAPPEGDPFSVTAALGPCPWDATRRLALVALQARQVQLEQAPPMNLVFLVDVSGSMQPANKLPLVQQALGLLVDTLRPQDKVALAVYAGSSGLVLDSTPGDRREELRSAIERLQAGGSTNGGSGILLAYAVAERNLVPHGINRVILATDGDFNVGTTGTGDLIRLVEEKRQGGVGLTVLGFGMGNLRDELLEQLADRGNGSYAYVDNLAEAQKVLRAQGAGTLLTVAKDVKVQVEFNPRQVAAYRLLGYENRRLQDEDFRDDAKDAGDMGAGHSVTALYEITPVGAPGLPKSDVPPLRYSKGERKPRGGSVSNEWLSVRTRWKPPLGGEARERMVTLEETSSDPGPEMRFAATVAHFALLLREPKPDPVAFAAVAERAREASGHDPFGWRAEMVGLAQEAGRLARERLASR
jgi:Ca-activated chloride channel family protein